MLKKKIKNADIKIGLVFMLYYAFRARNCPFYKTLLVKTRSHTIVRVILSVIANFHLTCEKIMKILKMMYANECYFLF